MLLFACLIGGVPARGQSRDAIRWALGQLESGDRDGAQGAHHEVSRYQILPRVWARYSRSRDYRDESVAWSVARRILEKRARDFTRQTGRPPDAVELYALWNAPSAFARLGFRLRRLPPPIAERARRFANLVLDYDRRHRVVGIAADRQQAGPPSPRLAVRPRGARD